MVEPVLSELRKTTQAKQILELQIERKNYERAAQSLEQSVSSGSSNKATSNKRKSTRIHKQSKKPKLHQCPDKLQVPGRSGTLGSNLVCLADAFDINMNKSSYYHELCRNRIIDISDDNPGSQLAMLNLNKKSNLVEKKLKKTFVNDVVNIKKITNLAKITNKKSAINCLEEAERFIPNNNKDRIMKRLLCNMLDLHVYQSFKLTDKYWRRCSEQSIIVKFWADVFETFFSYDEKLFLQWGDTLSTKHEEMNGWAMRLDLRLLLNIMDPDNDDYAENDQVEAATGEFTSTSNTSTTKLYKDKLKSVLTSKVHLNSILKSMKFVPPSVIKNIAVPIVQIMGTSCYIYTLSLVDKQVYCLQNVCSFCFPRTLKELRQEGFEKMINCITQLETIVSDVMDLQQSYSQDTSNMMAKVYGDKSDKEKTCVIEEYISALIAPADPEDAESSDNDNHEISDET